MARYFACARDEAVRTTQVACSPHEPTGRRKAPPDDGLREMRELSMQRSPDIAALIRATPASVRRNATRFSHSESVRCARVVRNISYNSQILRLLYFRARMNDQKRLNV